MASNSEVFQKNLAWGQSAETAIAQWLLKRGNSILPVYDIEYATGKGPRMFLPDCSLVAPDHLVFGKDGILWIECKHKSVFTWHRLSNEWQTGIDLRHYRHYLQIAERTKTPVWVLFAHESDQPDPRDLRQGCPSTCPTGLFSCKITEPMHHSHLNHGSSGMVYWSFSSLKKLDECPVSAMYKHGGFRG